MKKEHEVKNMGKALVIVESPAKAKTINKYLGKDFEVVSSMGHIIDLPKNTMGIEIENDFKADYIVIPERKKYFAQLKKQAHDKTTIYLAPDPDREGEAISWHLRNALDDKKKKFYRVVFDEITQQAIKEAFKHPRDIDMNLVNAQQARRILDRLVGYSISPILWRKVRRGLSAGRVQSVAVRLIVEREREIQGFKLQEYWEIDADLKQPQDAVEERFKAKLEKRDNVRLEITKKDQTDAIIEELKRENFIVDNVKESKKRKNPQPPFTTSKLQQESFNRLRFSATKTMRVAQMLYEGMELGEEGSVGLITYMRTDSVRISNESQAAAKEYILSAYGSRYYPSTPNVFKSKKTAQEAHEAIRPTLPLRKPESVREYLQPDQFKLYELIWKRFISSQMTQAVYSVVSLDIRAGRYLFKASDTQVVFDGFMTLYDVQELEEAKAKNRIPALKPKDQLDLLSLIPSQHFTKPPPRYSDGSLVKVLEEKGIGRPSTYAPIIQTIVLRDYVVRESGYLKPTELGFIVTDLLTEHFAKIMDVKFTARMEDELDGVEAGEIDYLVLLKSFYSPFMHSIEQAQQNMRNLKKEATATNEVCDRCGRPMVIKWGRKGKFLSCSGYPECTNSKSITSGVACPREGCSGELILRRSRRGPFYGCTKYPECTYVSRKLPTKDDTVESVSE